MGTITLDFHNAETNEQIYLIKDLLLFLLIDLKEVELEKPENKYNKIDIVSHLNLVFTENDYSQYYPDLKKYFKNLFLWLSFDQALLDLGGKIKEIKHVENDDDESEIYKTKQEENKSTLDLHNLQKNSDKYQTEFFQLFLKDDLSRQKISLFLNIFAHYPRLERYFSHIYQKLTDFYHDHQLSLFPIQNKQVEKTKENNEKFFEENYDKIHPLLEKEISAYFLKAILPYVSNNEKVTLFTSALIFRLIYHINSSEPYPEKITLSFSSSALKNFDQMFLAGLLNCPKGAILTYPGFLPQNLKEKNKQNFLLLIHYPANIRCLTLDNYYFSLLNYPNAEYKIIDQYIDNLRIVIELEYLLPEKLNIDIPLNFADFDLYFLEVMKLLKKEIFYQYWEIIYRYFLENLDSLWQIIEENNIKEFLNDIEITYQNSLEFIEVFKGEIEKKKGERKYDRTEIYKMIDESELFDEKIKKGLNKCFNEALSGGFI